MFKPIEQRKVETSLAIPEYFATLVGLRENHYVFNFAFNINRQEIKSKKLTKLKIKISRKNYEESIRKNTSLDRNFLTRGFSALQAARTKDSFLILEELVNIEELNSQYLDKRRVLQEVRPPNFDTQLQNYRNTRLDFFTLRDRNLSIIKTLKVDPSEVVLTDEYRKNSHVNTLFNYYLLESTNSLSKDRKYYYGIESNKVKTRMYVSRQIRIPEKYKSEQLEVTFELYSANSNNLVFEERKKVLVIQDLINIKNGIIQKPIIVEAPLSNQTTGLQISQNDPDAKGLQVQKKIISTNNHVSKYVTIFQAENLRKNNYTRIFEANSVSEIQIYRCTAYNSDPRTKTSSAFKNVILGTIPFIDSTTIHVSDNETEKAVEILVQNSPPEAIEFQILKRNLLNESYASFENYQQLSSFLPTRPYPKKVLDYNVIHDRRYEYSIKYKLNDGTIKDSAFKVHKYVDSSRYKSLQTTLSDLTMTMTNEGPSITFKIGSVSVEENNNLIQRTLSQSFQTGLADVFQKEFEKLKNKLQDLTFFKVTRINLSVSPAIEEEFKDILSSGEFNDNASTRKNSGISDINPNYDYMYEVRGYYKNPISLLKDLVITVPSQIKIGDGTKKKTYKFKPYKWLQQKTLNAGILSAESADGTLIQSSIVEDGDLGVVASVRVDKLEKLLELKSINAKRVDMKTIVLNWKIESSIEHYDHFVVVKESNSKRKILTTTQNLRHVDSIDLSEVGTIIYYVTPVYNDYTVGSTVRANTIIVNPEEFDSSI